MSRIHWNSIGLSRLTQSDRASLEAGRHPGDDGSGRDFRIDGTDDDNVVTLSLVPANEDAINIAWIDRSAPPPDEANSNTSAAPVDESAKLREELADALETLKRVMSQRDRAIEELEAERKARALEKGLTDRNAHADDIEAPVYEDQYQSPSEIAAKE